MFVRKAVVRGFEKSIERQPIWLIIVALASLFLDSFSLIIKVCLIDDQRPHAIGLEK